MLCTSARASPAPLHAPAADAHPCRRCSLRCRCYPSPSLLILAPPAHLNSCGSRHSSGQLLAPSGAAFPRRLLAPLSLLSLAGAAHPCAAVAPELLSVTPLFWAAARSLCRSSPSPLAILFGFHPQTGSSNFNLDFFPLCSVFIPLFFCNPKF